MASISAPITATTSRPKKTSQPERKKTTTSNESREQRRHEQRLPDPEAAMPMVPAREDDDDFTFPTPPQLLAVACNGLHDRRRVSHLPCSSPYSSPIRRSFSAADCAASPWRARVVLSRGGCCSPALRDYAAGFCDGEEEEEEEEERMDSLWEDLNDEEAGKEDLFLGSLDVSRRRSVGGPDLAERRRAAKGSETAVLGASRSSRRRSPGLVVMMRALKKLFVAHKGKSKVHKVDEQSATSASASASSCSNSGNK